MLRYMAEITWRDGESREEVARCGLKELSTVLSMETDVVWAYEKEEGW